MKRMMVFMLLVLMLGCSGRYAKHNGETGIEKSEAQTGRIAESEEIRDSQDAGSLIESDESVESSGLKPAAAVPAEISDAFFDFDKYDIGPAARKTLSRSADWLNENKSVNILIEGHCDDRGTNEYNLALGESRANSTRNYLISLGISPSRMKTISYGEEKPACMEQSETCRQLNRRAHLVAD